MVSEVRVDCWESPGPWRRKAKHVNADHGATLRHLLAVRATQSRFVAFFIKVSDGVLVDQQIRAAETSEFDAIPVVPYLRSSKDFTVGQNHGNGRARWHLLHVIKILGECLVWRCRLLPRRRGRLRRRLRLPWRNVLFLHVGES